MASDAAMKSNLLGSLFLLALLSLAAAVAAAPAGLANAQTSTLQLSIASQNTNGSTITGYYTTLSQNGKSLGSGFTPTTFTLESGGSYAVRVDDYGICHFNHWLDTGGTNATRVVSITSNTTLTAVYNCGAAVGSSFTVISLNQNGAAISGLDVNVNTGNNSQSGFTPDTFPTTPGATYFIEMYNYGSCTFTKWSDGVTSQERFFIAASDPTTLTAIYYCGTTPPVRTTSTINISAERAPNSSNMLDYTFIQGLYVTLWQNGLQIGSCFSTCAFTVSDGGTYQVIAESYGNLVFNHWNIQTPTGIETATGPVTVVTPSPGTNFSLQAVYDSA